MSESGGKRGGRRKSHDRKLKSKSSNHSTSRRKSRHAQPSRKKRTSRADSDSSDSDKADSNEDSSSSSERDKPRQNKKRARPHRRERDKNSRHERKNSRQRHERDGSSRGERSRARRRGRHESDRDRDRGRNSHRGERSMHSSHSSRSPPSSYRSSSRSRRGTKGRSTHQQEDDDDDDSDDDDDEDDDDKQNPKNDTKSMMTPKAQSQYQTKDGFNTHAIMRANAFENYPVICKCVKRCSKCCSPQVPFYIISVFDFVMGALLIALCVLQPYIVEAAYGWSDKTTTILARTDPKKALKITHLETLHAVFLALTGVLYVVDGVILMVGVFQYTVGPCILHAVFIFLNTFLLATCLVLFDVYTTSILTAYRKNNDLWSSSAGTSGNLEFAEQNKQLLYGLYIGMTAVMSLLSVYFSICSYLYAKHIRAQNDGGQLSFFRSIVHSFDEDIHRRKYEETEDD